MISWCTYYPQLQISMASCSNLPIFLPILCFSYMLFDSLDLLLDWQVQVLPRFPLQSRPNMLTIYMAIKWFNKHHLDIFLILLLYENSTIYRWSFKDPPKSNVCLWPYLHICEMFALTDHAFMSDMPMTNPTKFFDYPSSSPNSVIWILYFDRNNSF